ncbi:MAG: hypothetical protein EON60_08470 [Alphaproteobacteria bacterium]|nr:MAG: hypothetical protein EON60_08470 [Alphaproteobacteria bacterium]
MIWISFIIAISIPLVLGLGLWNRISADKGIGWQFMRFSVVATALPLVGVLALNGMLSGEASTIIGMAIGYAFGKKSE